MNSIKDLYFGDDILSTERTVLRPWCEADAERLYSLASEKELAKWCGFKPHTSVADSLNVLHNILISPQNRAIVLKSENAVVGSFGMFNSDVVSGDDECELGYWLGREYWGRGLVPEAVKAVMGYARNTRGVNRVYIAYFDGNDRSRRVTEKCGFKYAKTLPPKEWTPTGKIITEHLTKFEF